MESKKYLHHKTDKRGLLSASVSSASSPLSLLDCFVLLNKTKVRNPEENNYGEVHKSTDYGQLFTAWLKETVRKRDVKR